jgi:hypothetical protein
VREDHTISTVLITVTTKEEPTEDKTIEVATIARVWEIMIVAKTEITIVQDHSTIGKEVIIAVLTETTIVRIARIAHTTTDLQEISRIPVM